MIMHRLCGVLIYSFLSAFVLIFLLFIIGIIVFLVKLAYEILYSLTNHKIFSIFVMVIFMLMCLGIGTTLTFLS